MRKCWSAARSVYEKPALTHFHHARWRKMFWWGEAPQVHVRHNTNYLIASRAVPNYDQSMVVSEAALAALGRKWTGTEYRADGRRHGRAHTCRSTGGRKDIGLLPAGRPCTC